MGGHPGQGRRRDPAAARHCGHQVATLPDRQGIQGGNCDRLVDYVWHWRLLTPPPCRASIPIDNTNQAIQNELLDGDGSGADPLEFAEASQRVLDKIKDADFLAYSNNFSSYGNGGGGTNFLDEAHKAVTPALEAYKELVVLLKLI